MSVLRRAMYNPELVIFERWRVPYAPAYGWRHAVRCLLNGRTVPSPVLPPEQELIDGINEFDLRPGLSTRFGYCRACRHVYPPDQTHACADRPEWSTGTAVVVTHPDSGYTGQRGTVVAVYTDNPAALASGCPILDVALVGGPTILVAANAVEPV